METIKITDLVGIRENEIKFEFIRSSGPGGQNVNKVATAVQLRFDLNNCSLPEDILNRLKTIARNRINENDILIITARRCRSQDKNRKDAVARLVALVQKAAIEPKPRRKPKLSKAVKEQRLKEKRLQGKKKQNRKSSSVSEE